MNTHPFPTFRIKKHIWDFESIAMDTQGNVGMGTHFTERLPLYKASNKVQRAQGKCQLLPYACLYLATVC